MSSQYISATRRQRVAKESRFRCAYCLTSQHIIGPLLEIDHIIPEARGGTSDEANLVLACPLCNSHKGPRTEAIYPLSKTRAKLFNPRKDEWQVHFEWVKEGTVIDGKTPKGRATVMALNMNHPDVVAARQLWATVGWHPPKD